MVLKQCKRHFTYYRFFVIHSNKTKAVYNFLGYVVYSFKILIYQNNFSVFLYEDNASLTMYTMMIMIFYIKTMYTIITFKNHMIQSTTQKILTSSSWYLVS